MYGTNLTIASGMRDVHEGVVAGWHDILARTSFAGGDHVRLHRQLATVVERIIESLVSEPFSREDAKVIGVDLSRLRYVPADELGPMLEELSGRLVSTLAPTEFVTIQSRLFALSAAIMTGFIREENARVADEQRAVHLALLNAYRTAESALRASEDRNRAVLCQVTEGIILADAESGRVLDTNAAFQQLLGYTSKELAEVFLYQLIAHDRISIDENIRQTLRKGRLDLGERRCIRKDGTTVVVEASITAVTTASETLLCSVVRDVSERARAASELKTARRMLAEGREAERLHLAQELHDGALQELMALHLQLSAAISDVGSGRPLAELLPDLAYMDEHLVELAREMRRVVGEFRPSGLDDAGLQGALECCLAQLRATSNGRPTVLVRIDPRAGDLPGPITLCLFRVAQEAVRNAFRHAHAGTIIVRLRLGSRAAILRVSDDGCGFAAPGRLSVLAQEHHFGLAGMAERVEMAEGRLRVRSRPDRGTTVTVWLPTASEKADECYGDPDPAR